MIAFLHGFTGHPETFEQIACHLPRSMHAVCEPIFGHRELEESEAAGTTFEREVDRLAQRLLAFKNERLHLVGYSLGGRLVLGLLVRHPGLTSQATCIGVDPGLATEAERAARRAADERWAELLERDGIVAFVEAWAAQPIFASQRTLPKAILERQRALRLRHHPLGLARALRSLGLGVMPDLSRSLPGLRVPLAIVHGAQDSKFAALSERMAASLPSARRVAIEGAGHNPLLEQPLAVARLLTEGDIDAQR